MRKCKTLSPFALANLPRWALLFSLAACARSGGSAVTSTLSPPPKPVAAGAPSDPPSETAVAQPTADELAQRLTALGCPFHGDDMSCALPTRRADLDVLFEALDRYESLAALRSDLGLKLSAAKKQSIKIALIQKQDDQRGPGLLGKIRAERTDLSGSGCALGATLQCSNETSALKLLNRDVAAGRLQVALEELPRVVALPAAQEKQNAADAAVLAKTLPAMRKSYESLVTRESQRIETIQKSLDTAAAKLGATLGFEVLALGNCDQEKADHPVEMCSASLTVLQDVNTRLLNEKTASELRGRHIDLLTLHIVASGSSTVQVSYSADRASENLEARVSSADEILQFIASAPKRGEGADAKWEANAKEFLETLKAVTDFLSPLPLALDPAGSASATFSTETPALKNLLAALESIGRFRAIPMSRLWLGLADSGDGAFFDGPRTVDDDGELEFSSLAALDMLAAEIRKMVAEVLPRPTPAPTPKLPEKKLPPPHQTAPPSRT